MTSQPDKLTLAFIRKHHVMTLATVSEGHPLYDTLRKAYLKRFPYAAIAPLSLWVLKAHTLKHTDNTLGFGKKLLWNR